MTAFEIIVLIVGAGLLLLGGFSGYALFARALKIGSSSFRVEFDSENPS